jgi:hypothetical protein
LTLTDFEPLTFTPAAGRPLLIVGCSKTKLAVSKDQLVRFGDLYAGPMWLQIKAAGYPMTNVAAISALHGFLLPGMPIRTYDRVMDAKIADALCRSGGPFQIASTIEAAGSAFVVGGMLYRSIVEAAITAEPSIADRVTFATGSFLKMRGQLARFLKSECRS